MVDKHSRQAVAERRPDPIDIEVGMRIRLRRKELGVSQMALADSLDLSFQQVQKYERGTNRISTSALVKAAQRLQCSVADLVGETPGKALANPTLTALGLPGAVELLLAYANTPVRQRPPLVELARMMAGKR